jgi:NADH:ubiquinone oxidoreductase subunit C
MLLTNNSSLIKLLIGFRIGLTSVILNTFNLSYLQINIISGFNLQIEFTIKYLYPFLLFCKKHSLSLFNILTDIVCYEFLGSKFRFVLIYTLLNTTTALRLYVKVKSPETNFNLLSITSLFYTAS